VPAAAASSVRAPSTMTDSGSGCAPSAAARTGSLSWRRSAAATHPASGSTESRTTKIELVPTTTYASYLNPVESHCTVIRQFVVRNADYLDWDALAFALPPPRHLPQQRPPNRRTAAAETRHRNAAGTGEERVCGPAPARQAKRVSTTTGVGDRSVRDCGRFLRRVAVSATWRPAPGRRRLRPGSQRHRACHLSCRPPPIWREPLSRLRPRRRERAPALLGPVLLRRSRSTQQRRWRRRSSGW